MILLLRRLAFCATMLFVASCETMKAPVTRGALEARAREVVMAFYRTDSVGVFDGSRPPTGTSEDMRQRWLEVLSKAKLELQVEASHESCAITSGAGRYRIAFPVGSQNYREEGTFHIVWRSDRSEAEVIVEQLIAPRGFRKVQ